MKIVIRQHLALLALCCAPALADTSLKMQTDIPEVSIESRGAGHDFVRLPALSFAFTFHASCSEDLLPVSLQLSVADTRKTLRGNEITANNATLTALNIPANQIAPVVIKDFCARRGTDEIDSQSRNQQSEIILPAALSAQASLRCASEADEQTVYVSGPLDVSLRAELRPNQRQTPDPLVP